jgi:2-polyprenyl-6-methoxyphenol hydroxylase-like FAD-dependent oxidoreductase
MRENRTLFLFVFTTGNDALPETLDGQKELLLALYAHDKWKCPHILYELNSTQELYFDRVSQIRMPSWSRGRVALVGDAAFCVSFLAGQGSALPMTPPMYLPASLLKLVAVMKRRFGNTKHSCGPI